MYKLFLTLRYLRRRPIALVAIVAMALCVFMVLVVASVMNGFLAHVEDATRGIMGDVVIDGRIDHYDDLVDRLEARDEIAAATPAIYTAGLLKVRAGDVRMVSVVGVKLPGATDVTAFGNELYPPRLKAAPAFTIPPAAGERLHARNRQAHVMIDVDLQRTLQQLADEIGRLDPQQDADAVRRLDMDMNIESQRAARLKSRYHYDSRHPGLFIGVDTADVARRDETTGEYTRYYIEGERVQLTLLPLGRGNVSVLTKPAKKIFTLVGDQRFKLYHVDSNHVYVDFDELQTMTEMDGRCDVIQILAADKDVEGVTAAWRAAQQEWAAFADDMQMDPNRVMVRTWRQRGAQYIDAIEKQRDLMVIILGIVSLVAVVLVFAIFYMMVVQKIKDIGIIKSIGASNAGVASVFLCYGSAIGLVGSVVGAVGGYYFVRNINAIHDWIARVLNWRVFNRQAYMFDRIPDQVSTETVVWVMVGAILAGLVGAILPALRAARMQPVEALRYE